MRRAGTVALGLLVILAILLAVNVFVLGSQSEGAAVSADGGEILELSTTDLQVFDSPATAPGARAQPPIVLLHCFGCSSQWWDPVLGQLNRRHRVIRIDLIGQGGSAKPTSGYEIDAQAAAAAEALSELDARGATVVGHSLGGMVATALAERASELVDRVVTIGTPAEPGTSGLPTIDRVVRTPVIGEALWRIRIDSLIESGYESAFAPGFDVEAAFDDPDRVVEDNRAMTYNAYSEAGEAGGDFLEEQSIPTRLSAAGVPLLAILGAEDEILDAAEASSGYEEALDVQVEVLEGVGHSPNVESPEQTAELILGFAAGGAVTESRAGRQGSGESES